MKVLFVTGLSGKALGGGRTEEVRLMRGMAGRGCQVAMCSDLPGELSDFPHFPLELPRREKWAAQLAHAMAAFRPEIVHAVGGSVQFLNICNRQFAGIPWVFTAHNIPPSEHMFRRFYSNTRFHYAVRGVYTLPKRWAWSRYLKTADFRIAFCHSQWVDRDLKNAGCPADKICEIPFGSDLPASAPLSEPADVNPFPDGAWPKIVTVAGMAFPKGQLDAVRMASRLVKDFPKLDYCLIGSTRDRNFLNYIEGAIRSLGLSQNVRVLRTVPENVKLAALRNADLYVQPSHEEGFCIAYLEAAMLVPRLLGTDAGVIAAMSEGDATARVVEPRNPLALEQAARELLRQEIPPDAVEKRRLRLGQRYSWEAYIDAHLKSYQAIHRN